MTEITPSRRRMLELGGASLLAAGRAVGAPARTAVRTVAFDAFPIFNPNAVFANVRRLVPDHPEMPNLWFQKVFSDTWLRTSARRYVAFEDVLAESLDYVAASLSAPIGASGRDEILGSFSALDLWPDARGRLAQLKAAGLRLVFLSNMSEPMLRANMRHNGVEALFDGVLSTDRVQRFKPAPEAYAMALQDARRRKPDVLFAAFASWDAAGAAWFGYPTAWVNRAQQRPEPGAPRVRTGADLGVVCEMALT